MKNSPATEKQFTIRILENQIDKAKTLIEESKNSKREELARQLEVLHNQLKILKRKKCQ